MARWGKEWHYTHVAVGKNVLAGAINHALYLGVAATLVQLLPWAIRGLLDGATWTKRGSAPGEAVENLWDKNKNGWIESYFQKAMMVQERLLPQDIQLDKGTDFRCSID